MEWVSNIYDYAWAVGAYWIAIFVWVAFIMGDGAAWSGFRDALDRIVPRQWRRPLELLIMVVIVFFAGFEAWQDQVLEKNAAISQRDKAEKSSNYWSGIAKAQDAAITGSKGYLAQIDQYRSAPPKIVPQYLPVPPIKVEVASQGPDRHLTELQKAKLVENLKPIAASLENLLVFSSSGDEPGVYADEFRKVIAAAGVKNVGMGLTSAIETESGLMVGVADPNNPPASAKAFFGALKNSGLEPKFTLWSQPLGPFDLFIGRSKN